MNGLVEGQKIHLGCFIRTTTQQNIIHWSDQAEIYTFAHNIQTLAHSPISPFKMVFKGESQIPIEFHLEFTRDQNNICTNSFCRYLQTHSHNTLTDQNKIVQPMLSKPLLTYTLEKYKSFI